MYILYIELSNYAQKTLCNSRFAIKKSTSNYARIMLKLCSKILCNSRFVINIEVCYDFHIFKSGCIHKHNNPLCFCIWNQTINPDNQSRQSIQNNSF